MNGCPNCREPMMPRMIEAHGTLAPIEINLCEPCSLLWFDKWESVRLTPKSVIELFQLIGKAGSPRRTLASQFDCPRCTIALALTYDVQRTTRFTYWRCKNDEGQLITFNQFLRQKNFIRTPTPPEIAKLRATVRQIACSQCGAPVNLATESACPHCAAPVSLIDPDGITKTLQELSVVSSAPGSAAPDAMRTALSDAQINAIFDLHRVHQPDGNAEADLVAIGAAAIGALISGLLRPS